MMSKFSTLLALGALSSLASAQASTCAIGGDSSIVANTGTPVGTEQVVDGSEFNYHYIQERANMH